jgi:hypothetical protein
MVPVSSTSRKTGIRGREEIAFQLPNESAQQNSRIRNAMILLAIVMVGAATATHAFAAGMGGGLGLNGGFGGVRAVSGFHTPVFNSAPPPAFNMPAPNFNPSESYTVPESRETPVSPASPGSVFGNG